MKYQIDSSMKCESRIFVATDTDDFVRIACKVITKCAVKAASKKTSINLALCGGKTPIPVYKGFVTADWVARMPWYSAHVYWGDDHCVLPNHQASNYGMANKYMLSKLDLKVSRVHRIKGEYRDPERAASEYHEILPVHFDIILMGMGAEGHVACLYPGEEALNETEKRAVVVNGPKPPNPRITITPPVITNAHNVIMMVRGDAKAKAVRTVLTEDVDFHDFPGVLARDGVWVLDKGSASLLPDNLKISPI